MDKINVDTEESRRILETDNYIDDEQEHDMFTKEDEEAKDNIVKLSNYNFSKSPKKQEKSPSKKKLSRGMSFQTNPMARPVLISIRSPRLGSDYAIA